MAELDHLSHSSIAAYLACPHGWRLKYIEKIPTVATPALAFGSAFHGAAERYIAERATGNNPDPVSLWTEAWTTAIQQEISWGGEIPEQLSNQGLQMLCHKDVRAALDNLVPMLDEEGAPIIERRVELRVPGVPVPILGFIDTILADGSPADLKTAARSWSQDKADLEMQAGYYLAALQQAGYTQNPDYGFTYVVFVKTRTPQVQVLKTRRKPADLFWLFWMIRQVWSGIQADVFPPNPGSWFCSPDGCSYWRRCRGRR